MRGETLALGGWVLCDFPGHQTLKFDFYFPYSVCPPFVIQDFRFLVAPLGEIESVLKRDLIQFRPKTRYGLRNIGIIHETILYLGPINCC